MRILDNASMREADRITIEGRGVPSLALMERAGEAVAARAAAMAVAGSPVVVLCGKGGNGGDGLVAARLLHERGRAVRALVAACAGDLSPDAAANLRRALASGVAVTHREPGAIRPADLVGAGLLLDALFGTGLARGLGPPWDLVVGLVNACGVPVLSIDLPSGLSGSSAELPDVAIRARATVALAAPKWPHVLLPAAAACGEVHVADIGIDVEAGAAAPGASVITAAEALAAFSPRPTEGHKGTFGRLVMVAGSRGMPGAALLAVDGALAGGAGLVTLASVPSACAAAVARHPDVLLAPLPESAEGGPGPGSWEVVAARLGTATACLVGPGLTQVPAAREIVARLVAEGRVPLVLDADGCNAVADAGLEPLAARAGPTVLTPHPGEMRRLLGEGMPGSRVEAARALARRGGAVAVLKGHRTVVARPDGEAAVCLTGGPALARGGTGDVLAGLLASILARGVPAWDAARAAVYLHGLAGDLLARARGEHMARAGLLGDALPDALRAAAARAAARVPGGTVALGEL